MSLELDHFNDLAYSKFYRLNTHKKREFILNLYHFYLFFIFRRPRQKQNLQDKIEYR